MAERTDSDVQRDQTLEAKRTGMAETCFPDLHRALAHPD
jgi:hypothetical protein